MMTTMEADPTKAYNQDDATGFIRLNALRLKVAAKVRRKKQPTMGLIARESCPPSLPCHDPSWSWRTKPDRS